VAAPAQRGGAELPGSAPDGSLRRAGFQEQWSRAPRFFTSAALRALWHEEIPMTKLLALIAATLLAFAAQAGDDKDKTHDMKSTATFDSLDKNADSQISKTEASADSKLSDNFAALDTNGDGYLSKSEYMARSKT
jgi:EF hand